MKHASPAPPWSQFHVLKHPPDHAHLDALYCLAAVARWLHRFDAPKKPTIQAIIKAMMAAVPPDMSTQQLTEKHLRMAADAYDLRLYRPNVGGITDTDWPPDWIWLAAVRGIPVPRLREPPPERRHVLVLGLPDDQARFLVADPHPETPDTYKVPIEKFGPAWQAGRTKTHRPWAGVVGKMVWHPIDGERFLRSRSNPTNQQ